MKLYNLIREQNLEIEIIWENPDIVVYLHWLQTHTQKSSMYTVTHMEGKMYKIYIKA